MSRIAVRDGGPPELIEGRRRARSFYAAHLRRERTIRRTRKLSGIEQAFIQENAIADRIRPVREAVYGFACASIADLSAKLAFIARLDGMEDGELLPLVMADVARLAGEARA